MRNDFLARDESLPGEYVSTKDAGMDTGMAPAAEKALFSMEKFLAGIYGKTPRTTCSLTEVLYIFEEPEMQRGVSSSP